MNDVDAMRPAARRRFKTLAALMTRRRQQSIDRLQSTEFFAEVRNGLGLGFTFLGSRTHSCRVPRHHSRRSERKGTETALAKARRGGSVHPMREEEGNTKQNETKKKKKTTLREHST